jgi:sugar phosphate isomerase/epimerase
MNVLFFKSTWGMEEPSLRERLQRIAGAGFDGVELGVPDSLPACVDARAMLEDLGLAVIVQQWTRGLNAREHAESFAEQYQRAVRLKPLCINSHTARDWFTLEESLVVFDAATRLEREGGVPVVHETHRGRALFSTSATSALLSERPSLKLTADFSHWCCVHESLLEDQPEAVALGIQRAFHVHARVGHSQGPQVSDPRAGEWSAALKTHLGWWRRIVETRRAEDCQVLPICPEFGPPPYMPTYPGTNRPVADLWEVNCWMRDWLRGKL